jgi:F-type H+-transporting ATPase subunit b
LNRQLVEQSREAAGEEEENAEFKHSPSVQWFAKHTGLSVQGAYWLGFIINFAIIAGAIIYFWRSKAPAAFRERRANIRKDIDEARRVSYEANHRLAEIEERLSRIDSEISQLKKGAESDTATEEERIRQATVEDTRKVLQSAEHEMDAIAKTARRDLKIFAAELAVSLAEQRINIDRDTDRALVRSFVNDLTHAQDGGGQ